MSTSSTARVAFIVEPSVCMRSKDHVTSTVCDAVMRIGGHVIKELVDGSRGGFGCSRLLAANSAESDKEFVVDCTSVVEEGTNNTLNPFGASIIERRTGFFCVHKLGLGTIGNLTMFVRRELTFGRFGWLYLRRTSVM